MAIARALISRPQFLICDEPTSALDVSVQSQILNLLQDLRREFGLTLLLISHDLSVIRHMSDRVMIMYMGRVVESAPTETLFSDPHHPYSRALIDSALPITPGHGVPDLNLQGEFPNPINPPSGCSFHPRCAQASTDCMSIRPELVSAGDRSDGARELACHHPLSMS